MKNEQRIIDRLDLLLGKYYAGRSTIEEEKLISSLFGKLEECPERLRQDKTLFDALSSIERQYVPDTLISSLESKIDEWNEAEIVPKKLSLRTAWLKISGIAAGIALVAVLSLHFMPSTTDTPAYTEQQMRFAYEDAQKALLIVSQNLNKADEMSAK